MSECDAATLRVGFGLDGGRGFVEKRHAGGDGFVDEGLVQSFAGQSESVGQREIEALRAGTEAERMNRDSRFEDVAESDLPQGLESAEIEATTADFFAREGLGVDEESLESVEGGMACGERSRRTGPDDDEVAVAGGGFASHSLKAWRFIHRSVSRCGQ